MSHEIPVHVGAIINNCYILRERFGSDAYSDIWRASALFSATNFILRFLRDGIPPELCEAERRLVMEAYDVRHAAILDVVEVDRFEGITFISTEYSGASTLESMLAGGASFTLDHICGFLLELARALDVFHRRGLVYGTLNLKSVLASMETGVVSELKLVKPGFRPLIGTLPDGDPGFILANHGFLSPECKGVTDYPIDQRSDLYSLGVLLYRLVTGYMPFRGQSASRAKDKAVSVRHVSNALIRRDIPDELACIAVRCVRRNPALRYAGMVDLVRDLKAFLDRRRFDSIRNGVADPLADLDKLNTRKSEPAAEQVVRTLDMAEYFRALTGGQARAPLTSIISNFPSAPITGNVASDSSIEELEELESLDPAGEDDERMRADEYVALSRMYLSRPVPDASAVKAADDPSRIAAQAGRSLPLGPGALADSPSDSNLVVSEPNAVSTSWTVSGLNELSPQKSSHGTEVVWRLSRIGLDAMQQSILNACESSRSRKGSFKYVERLPTSDFDVAIGRTLAIIEKSGAVIMIPGRSGTSASFPEALVRSLDEARSRATPSVRKRLKTVGAAALESTVRVFHIQGPDTEMLSGDVARYAYEAAAALARIGTRLRPLVLVLEEGAYDDPRLMIFLNALAGIAPHERVCVIALFEGESPVPPSAPSLED